MSNIVVPVLGESIVEARIAKWLKKAGDPVEVGDPLVELETEKTNLELSAEKRGVISSIARQEGEDVKIGEVLAVVDEHAASAAQAPPAPAPPSPPAGNGSGAAKPEAAPTSNKVAPTKDKLAPTSNKVAPTESKVAPTSNKVAPTRIGDRTEQRVRMTKRRETIARRLVEAQRTAAMLTTFNEV